MIALCLLILSGCETPRLINDPVAIPPDLLQPCDPIAPLKIAAKMTDLMQADIDLIESYKSCSQRLDTLASIVK